MLKQRIITALFLLPLVITLFLMVPLEYFATAVAIVIYLVGLEWAKLAGLKLSLQCSLYAAFVTAINLILWLNGGDFRFWPSLSWPSQVSWDWPMLVLGLAVLAILLAVIIVVTYSRYPKWWANTFIRSLLGIILLPAFFVALMSIRSVAVMADFHHGGLLVLLMFCMIWAADTGAFIAGKAFGKHALAPVVSPNKTWEGAIGGLTLSLIVAWIGAYLLRLNIEQPGLYSLVAFLLAGLSVMGDLFESALKRVSNIKDSGNLLPGHGGMLDRLDSSIVVAPLFFLTYSYFGWF